MDYLETLQSIKPYVEEAGRKIIFPNIGKARVIAKAGDVSSVVTETDLAVGEYLLPVLREQFLGSFAEEDMHRGYVGHRWVLDNLDGTGEFEQGVYRGSSIVLGLLNDQNVPMAGMIHIPQTRETIWGTRYDGPFYERDEIKTSLRVPPKDRIIASQRELAQAKKLDEFLQYLSERTGLPVEVVMTGGNGSAYLRLMNGEMNLFIFPIGDTKEWDSAAAEPMLYRLHGRLTDLSEYPLKYGRYGEYGVWHTNGVMGTYELPERLTHKKIVRYLAEFSTKYGPILIEKIRKR